MNLFYNDFDKRFLSAAQPAADPDTIHISHYELDRLRRKAHLYDVLIAMSQREISTMWDFRQATSARDEVLLGEIETMLRANGRL